MSKKMKKEKKKSKNDQEKGAGKISANKDVLGTDVSFIRQSRKHASLFLLPKKELIKKKTILSYSFSLFLDVISFFIILNMLYWFSKKMMVLSRLLLSIDMEQLVPAVQDDLLQGFSNTAGVNEAVMIMFSFIKGVIIYTSILFAVIFLTILVTRSLIWAMIVKVSDKEDFGLKKLTGYLVLNLKRPLLFLKFFAVDILWFLIFLPFFIYPLIIIAKEAKRMDASETIVSSQLPDPIVWFAFGLLFILFMFFSHLVSISRYGLFKSEKVFSSFGFSFRTGIGKVHYFVVPFVMIGLSFVVILLLQSFLSSIGLSNNYVFFFLFAIGMSYVRFYYGRILQENFLAVKS